MTKIAIVGAGLAGLTAARNLSRICSCADIHVFEKSWRSGGRLCARQKAYHFDHGAQYFTARSAAFKNFIAPFVKQGIIARWVARFIELERKSIVSQHQWNTEYPHYVAVPGMNAFCHALATDINVKYNTRITSMRRVGEQWQLKADDNTSLGSFDWVITAIPAQQAAELMPVNFSHTTLLRQKRMQACYTLMPGFGQPLTLEFDCALVNYADISWIAVNNSKPGRPAEYSLVIHSSIPWAEANIGLENDSVTTHLINQTCDVLKQDVTQAEYINLHRWRYANVDKQTGKRH